MASKPLETSCVKWTLPIELHPLTSLLMVNNCNVFIILNTSLDAFIVSKIWLRIFEWNIYVK